MFYERMEHRSIELTSLPDEILLMIFKKVNKISLLYSLMGVNERIDEILCDSTFTKSLSLIEHFSFHRMCLFNDQIMDRFCLEILPRIEDRVEWITVEYSSMERVLLSGNYSNLSGLEIDNANGEDMLHYFSGEIVLDMKRFINRNIGLDQSSLIDLFKKQITSLVVQTMLTKEVSCDVNSILFANIVKNFSNLKSFNSDPIYCRVRGISFLYIHPDVVSTTLLELHVNIREFQDCFCILDGRFSQLRRLNVKLQTSSYANSRKYQVSLTIVSHCNNRLDFD